MSWQTLCSLFIGTVSDKTGWCLGNLNVTKHHCQESGGSIVTTHDCWNKSNYGHSGERIAP